MQLMCVRDDDCSETDILGGVEDGIRGLAAGLPIAAADQGRELAES